jgi:hypothetical protein
VKVTAQSKLFSTRQDSEFPSNKSKAFRFA